MLAPVKLPATGSRIRLLSMPDDPDPVPVGTLGVVISSAQRVGNGWQVGVRWANGRTLNLAIPPDTWEYVS
jgi:hypothetical protein